MPTEEHNFVNLPVVYSNNVRVSLSFSDIKLFFSEFMPAPSFASPTELQQATGQLVDRVCITLSPDVIPALVNGLVHAIKTFETQFGPLRPIPEIMLPSAQTPKTEPVKP